MGKQIAIQQFGVCELGICIHKPAPARIVVPTPEVIQPDFLVVNISTIAEGIECTERRNHSPRFVRQSAPNFISIPHDIRAACVDNADDIAL